MIEKLNAILALRPNAQFRLDGDVLTWTDSEQTEPTALELSNEVTRLQAAYDALEYSRLRKAKYDLLNQFELIGDDATNGTTTHKDAIAAIKAAHPKP